MICRTWKCVPRFVRYKAIFFVRIPSSTTKNKYQNFLVTVKPIYINVLFNENYYQDIDFAFTYFKLQGKIVNFNEIQNFKKSKQWIWIVIKTKFPELSKSLIYKLNAKKILKQYSIKKYYDVCVMLQLATPLLECSPRAALK